MKLRFALFMLLVAGTRLASNPSPAGAQILGVFADANGTDCDITVQQFSPTTLYVLALLGGQAADGIQGAEFRIDGVPPTWFPNWIGPLSCDFCTNPLQGGARLAWPTCQTGTGGVVLLGTIQMFAIDQQENVYIEVRGHSTPLNPDRPGPNVILCTPPYFTVVDVGTTQLILNGAPCTIAVQTNSWSRVKSLYE